MNPAPQFTSVKRYLRAVAERIKRVIFIKQPLAKIETQQQQISQKHYVTSLAKFSYYKIIRICLISHKISKRRCNR